MAGNFIERSTLARERLSPGNGGFGNSRPRRRWGWVFLALGLGLGLVSPGCDRPTPVAPSAATLTISANPTRIAVNGNSTITVLARKADGTAVNPGTEITFTSNIGTFDDTVVPTDDRGIAETVLRGDNRAGVATIVANSGAAAAAEALVDIGIGAQDLVLTISPSVISAEVPRGGHKITATATVTDESGNPIGGALVQFDAEVGEFRRGSSATADGSGIAQRVLTVTRDDLARVVAGTFLISATSPGIETPDERSVQISGGFAANLRLFAQPSSIPATGGVVSLRAKVFDSLNDPLPDVGIFFFTDGPGSLASGGAFLQTDANGEAFDVLTLEAAELISVNSVMVTVETGGGPGELISATRTITIQGVPLADFTFGIAGTVATFNSAVTGDVPLTLEWDFTSDGIIDASNTISVPNGQAVVVHDYGASGTEQCTLFVSNVFGTDSITKSVEIP